MRKFKYLLFIIVTFAFFSVFPIKSYALESNNIVFNYNIESLSLNNSFVKHKMVDCSSLDSNNEDDSVVWLLNKLLDYVKIGGPLIVVVLSSIDFAKVITTGDDDKLAKAKKKLFTRLILAASLFFLPVFVQLILSVFGITGDPTCGVGAIQRMVI